MSSHAATGPIDHHHDASTSTGIPNKKLLMWAFLASDCMFFGTLISTHLIYRLHPPAGNPSPIEVFDVPLTSFSTFILLMSSLMMALAVNAIQKGNLKSMRFSLLTTFFTLTGTHGLHVLIGVIWLISMYIYSFTGRLTERQAIDVESMGLYWHFVDIVWIVIFTAVYLLEYL
jgi:cytochrome o ubiquinol oxidase subunit 3